MQALTTGTALLAGRNFVFDGTTVGSDNFKQCPCCHAAMPSLSGSTALPVSGDLGPSAKSWTADMAAPRSGNFAKNRFLLLAVKIWSLLGRMLPMSGPHELTEEEISRLPVGPFGPKSMEHSWVPTMPSHMLAAGARADMTPIPRHRKF